MPFGDGTGPMGYGSYGYGRRCFGLGPRFGRGYGNCRYNFPYPVSFQSQSHDIPDEFLLAELKRIEAGITLLQQEHAQVQKIINEKKSNPSNNK